MKIALQIRANAGYGSDQVHNTLSVYELKQLLNQFNDDDEIVTFDLNNEYGAKFGSIVDLISEDEVDEDDKWKDL